MDAIGIISIILGSSVVSSLVSGAFNRKTQNADIDEKYADRLERRIKTLEDRLDVYEMRESIATAAINCAYACSNRAQGKTCPVLQHMEQHPMPPRERQSIDEGDGTV